MAARRLLRLHRAPRALLLARASEIRRIIILAERVVSRAPTADSARLNLTFVSIFIVNDKIKLAEFVNARLVFILLRHARAEPSRAERIGCRIVRSDRGSQTIRRHRRRDPVDRYRRR